MTFKKTHYFYRDKHNNIVAKKSLGQNFLQAQWVVEDICKHVDIEDKIILEVGAGTGFLTREILKHNPRKMIIIEKDRRMIEILQNLCKELHCEGKVKIINGDALKYKITDVLKEAICDDCDGNDCQNINNEKLTIIGNLPYNVGTTLVVNWNEQAENINEIVVMLQKEVVDRICATTNTKDYGRISVLIQANCKVKKLFDVSPECFNPKPKVMSSIVKIVPKDNNERITQSQYRKLDEFCKVAFSQRRKKLSNVLKHSKFNDIILPDFVAENSRAEDLSVEEYMKIINTI